MATKNQIAYALPIIQIIQILSDKFHKQMCLRLIYRERVGVVPLGLDVPKNPVFMRLSGLGTFRATVFATLLQHFLQKRVFGQMK
ncbi:MAG: hypothetical protein ACLUIH_01705 [Eubacterium sp.]